MSQKPYSPMIKKRGKQKKYNWEVIKMDYRIDNNAARICKKYNIPSSTLHNKIQRDGLRLTPKQTETIKNLKDDLNVISTELEQANPQQQVEMIVQANEVLARANIVAKNTNLLQIAQDILFKCKNKFNQNNIQNLTNAIKTIEAVANPPNTQHKTLVQVNNKNIGESLVIEVVDCDKLVKIDN